MVFTAIAIDPVAYSWVESYARPGGMVTGSVQNAIGGLETLMSTQFQFFKKLVPGNGALDFGVLQKQLHGPHVGSFCR